MNYKDEVETIRKEMAREQDEVIKSKMEELRKFSHKDVTDAKLRQGALLALGLK